MNAPAPLHTPLAPMMELAFLCRDRGAEIRNLSEGDILDKGIHLKRTKGSNDELTLWAQRLRAAVELARLLYPTAPASTDRRLFRGKAGSRLVDSSRKTAWSRVMKIALSQVALIDGKRKVLTESFTFNDLKAKGRGDRLTAHLLNDVMKVL